MVVPAADLGEFAIADGGSTSVVNDRGEYNMYSPACGCSYCI